MNRLIQDLEYTLASYQLAVNSKRGDAAYKTFVTHKMNYVILQIEQLKQKILDVKKCKDGDLFLMSTLEGQAQLSEGDDLLSVLRPISLQAEGATVSKIID